MQKLFLIVMISSLSLCFISSCVTKDRKCVKEHKKARKKHVGWQY